MARNRIDVHTHLVPSFVALGNNQGEVITTRTLDGGILIWPFRIQKDRDRSRSLRSFLPQVVP
jgi:hypothetical protein